MKIEKSMPTVWSFEEFKSRSIRNVLIGYLDFALIAVPRTPRRIYSRVD